MMATLRIPSRLVAALVMAALLTCASCGGAGGGGGGGGDCSDSVGGQLPFVEHSVDRTRVHGQGLEIVDMNGDGKDDLVVPYSLSDAIYIYLNGCENWQRIEVAAPNTMVATGVAAGDFDGDGDIDIAAVEPFARDVEDGSVRWFENPGAIDGTWEEHAISGNTIGGPLRILSADISGDGLLDLVVSTGSYGPGAMWFRNTGGGFEGPNEIDSSLENVYAILVHDVDGDGALDVITSSFDDAEISWYESDRGSSASETVSFSKHVIESVATPYGLALGNLDEDADLELVASHSRGIELYDPPADPSAVWTSVSLTSDFAGDKGVFMQVVDIDGDAHNDLAIASGDSAQAVVLVIDDALGVADRITVAGDYAGFNALKAGDINGDGKIDLVTSTYEHGGESDLISWWQNQLP